MCEILCSPEDQRRRCNKVAEITTGYLEKKISVSGEWAEELQNTALRERLYFALTFLRSGFPEPVRKANLIIQKAVYTRCHFSPMIALQILTKYRELLNPEAQVRLESYIDEHMEESAEDELDYLGVNDNFPSMAAYILVIGGQLFKRGDFIEKGKERLKHFCGLLTRRGVASEYNSPTYSPIQLLAMAEIANAAYDCEIRNMAVQCEWRIWADCLGHLHKETSQAAGPYSRAYADDSAGYTGLLRGCLYALLGDALSVTIMNTLLESDKGCCDAYSHNGALYGQANMVWLTDTIYSCPAELLNLAIHKQYPYEITATTEFTSSTDAPVTEFPQLIEGELANYEYPAGTGRIMTYMTEDYALGTATHEFHNGTQTDAFHLLYRRHIPVQRQKDIGTVYARYLIDEKMPVQHMVILEDCGRKLGVQHQNTAMVLYKPKPAFGASVHSLKLSLVIPVPGNGIEELWLGKRRMEGAMIQSSQVCSVFIQDGPVYMAFHPLLLTDHGREHAVTVQATDGYLVVSFYNYKGHQREFNMKELLLTGNGFVAEIGSRKECGSFEAFRKSREEFEIEDRWQSTFHSRFSTIRKTSFLRKDVSIACEYSPVTEGIKLLTVNGDVPSQEKLSMTGFHCSNLPFFK